VRILRGVPAGTPWTIFPNVQRVPTSEPGGAAGAAYAISKDAIARSSSTARARRRARCIQPPTPGYVPVAKELFPYDPARARKILDDRGLQARR